MRLCIFSPVGVLRAWGWKAVKCLHMWRHALTHPCVHTSTHTHRILSKEAVNHWSLNFPLSPFGFPFLFTYLFSSSVLRLKIWHLAGNGESVLIFQYYFILFSLIREPVILGYLCLSLLPNRFSGCRPWPPWANATLTSFPWGWAGHQHQLSGALCPALYVVGKLLGWGFLLICFLHRDSYWGQRGLLWRAVSNRFLVFFFPSELSSHFNWEGPSPVNLE